jgi:hypothetical protein
MCSKILLSNCCVPKKTRRGKSRIIKWPANAERNATVFQLLGNVLEVYRCSYDDVILKSLEFLYLVRQEVIYVFMLVTLNIIVCFSILRKPPKCHIRLRHFII